jgi:hypothetical protein
LAVFFSSGSNLEMASNWSRSWSSGPPLVALEHDLGGTLLVAMELGLV